MANIKAQLEIAVCRYQGRLKPLCQCCGAADENLHLHHIIRRAIIQHKELAALMPLCLHGLLCYKCNYNQGPRVMDHPDGRAWLLAQNARIFGISQVELALRAWGDIAGENEDIVSINDIRSYYDQPSA